MFTKEYFARLSDGKLLSWWIFYTLDHAECTPELIESAIEQFGCMPKVTLVNLLADRRYRVLD
jgi:hypothetical protein